MLVKLYIKAELNLKKVDLHTELIYYMFDIQKSLKKQVNYNVWI